MIGGSKPPADKATPDVDVGRPAAFLEVLKTPSPIDEFLSAKTSATERLALEKQRNPEFNAQLQLIDDLLRDKLYHQFTEACQSYLFDKKYEVAWAAPESRIQFLMQVVRPVMSKLSPLTILTAVRRVCDGHKGLWALKFISQWDQLIESSSETKLLCKSVQAYHLLHGGFVKECEQFLFDHLEPELETTFGLSGAVPSEFHRSAAAYCWHVQDLDLFYHHAMFFLQGCDLDDKVELAWNLCKAAVLSKKIYSFTELLHHPILEVVSPGGPAYPQKSLMRDLVVICNSGDYQMYSIFLEQRQAQILESGLAGDLPLIQRKITIFALLELAFLKPQKSRVLTFQEVSNTCRVPINEVETLVMKIMSHGLMSGTVDQVDQLISFTSLQPRLLDEPKIRALSEHFRVWSKRVSGVAKSVEKMSPELLDSGSVAVQ